MENIWYSLKYISMVRIRKKIYWKCSTDLRIYESSVEDNRFIETVLSEYIIKQKSLTREHDCMHRETIGIEWIVKYLYFYFYIFHNSRIILFKCGYHFNKLWGFRASVDIFDMSLCRDVLKYVKSGMVITQKRHLRNLLDITSKSPLPIYTAPQKKWK